MSQNKDKPSFKTVLEYYDVPFKTVHQRCPFACHEDRNPSHRHWREGTGFICTCSWGDSYDFIAYMEEILVPGEKFEDHPGTFKEVLKIAKTILERLSEEVY